MADTATPDTTAVKTNAEIAAKSWHTWVYLAISTLAGLLLWLGKDWVIQFIQDHPALAPAAPFVGALFVLAAQVAPQNIELSADRDKLRSQLLGALEQILTAAGIGPHAAAPVIAAASKMSTAELKATVANAAPIPDTQMVDVDPTIADSSPQELSTPAPAPTPAAPMRSAATAPVVQPVNPTQLAGAQLLAQRAGLMAGVRQLAPGLTDDQIRAALAAPPAGPQAFVNGAPA